MLHNRESGVGRRAVCRYFVSQHPEVERKIEAELDSLEFLVTSNRKTPRRLEYADLSKLPYLSGAIKAGPKPSQASSLSPELCLLI